MKHYYFDLLTNGNYLNVPQQNIQTQPLEPQTAVLQSKKGHTFSMHADVNRQ